MVGHISKWSEEKIQELIKRYPVEHSRQIAKDLGVSYLALKCKANVLRLRKAPGYRGISQIKLTEEQLQHFKFLYSDTPNPVLQRKFNLGESTVMSYARRFGLEKSEEFMSDPFNRSCFRKGHKPWNKGKKGSIKANSGSFKKGQVPKNQQPVGTITVRRRYNRKVPPYKWIKISEPNKWKMLHVFIWEQAHGPVPLGHMINFKDKDTMNCSLNNLMCLSRKQNALRNSGSIRLSDGYVAATISKDPEVKEQLLKMPEVLDLKRQSLILKREINAAKEQTG